MQSPFFRCALLGLTTIFMCGCALCDVGDLCSYSTVGGKWQRNDPNCGRVGSYFSDAGVNINTADSSADIISVDPPLHGDLSSEPFNEQSMPLNELTLEPSTSHPEGVVILGDDGHQ